MIKLRKLTQSENAKFEEWCRGGSIDRLADPFNLSLQKNAKNQDDNLVNIDDHRKFKNKLDLGKYLYEELKNSSMESEQWHFLVAIYQKQLLKKNGKIGEADRFFINPNKSYYPFTHLLKAVFDLYNFYHDQIDLIEFLLLNPVNESGQLFLETVKRQDLMKNKNFIGVVKFLFYDEGEKKIKRGILSDFMRLIALFKQYERTYDLYGMPANEIIEKLISKHSEFNKYRNKR